MSDADDLDLRAAEYVLGVLEPLDARAVEALSAHDLALRDAIARWEDRLAPLGTAIDPVSPPPELWARLALATGIGGREAAGARPGAFGRAWRSASVWRAATAGALALAASFALVAFLPASEPLPAARFEPRIAALVAADAPAPAFLVRAGADGRARIVALAAAPVPAGRDLQLWSLPQGAAQPASLGVLPGGGRTLLLTLEPGTRILVSLEPQGGSPTGQPTGPVLYAGVLTAAP